MSLGAFPPPSGAEEAPFDRPLLLPELLPPALLAKLWPALTQLVGSDAALLSSDGRLLAGTAPATVGARAPLVLELEPLGELLLGRADASAAKAAVQLLTVVARAEARFRMASELHTEAVLADYQELQRKHAALSESEARYRGLSTELEQRVESQVKTLDERQRQLYQAEKLASIGQLAAGVAHEINNPISFVRSNLSSARNYLEQLRSLSPLVAAGQLAEITATWRRLDLDFVIDDLGALFGDCIDGIDRVARIVKDLKGFSNIDQPEEALVNLNEILASVCQLAATQLPPDVHLVRDFQPLPMLMCLPGHLSQVFLNLVLNAIQAVNGHGEVNIASSAQGELIFVKVRDNGCGIAEQVLPRIFDPFFTTHDVGQGTGLGLTVARDIVNAHGGRIEVASSAGGGAVFTVTLPS